MKGTNYTKNILLKSFKYSNFGSPFVNFVQSLPKVGLCPVRTGVVKLVKPVA